MRHLRDDEIVDALDGALSESRERHLGSCAACRREVDAAADMTSRAAEVDVPEPSPLFWEHFQARVRLAVDEEPPPLLRASRTWSLRWATTAAVLLVLLVAGWIGRGDVPSAAEPTAAGMGRPVPAWELLERAADESVWDEDVIGFELSPGTTERVLATLSTDERQVLAQLIEAELSQSPR